MMKLQHKAISAHSNKQLEHTTAPRRKLHFPKKRTALGYVIITGAFQHTMTFCLYTYGSITYCTYYSISVQ